MPMSGTTARARGCAIGLGWATSTTCHMKCIYTSHARPHEARPRQHSRAQTAHVLLGAVGFRGPKEHHIPPCEGQVRAFDRRVLGLQVGEQLLIGGDMPPALHQLWQRARKDTAGHHREGAAVPERRIDDGLGGFVGVHADERRGGREQGRDFPLQMSVERAT
eukprot:scaffold2610_cov115-Isochrysis_galbana.AAC.7